MRIDPYAQKPVNNCSWLSGWLQGCWVFSCLHYFPSSPAGVFLSYWDCWLKMLLKLTQHRSLLELSGGFMGMVSCLSQHQPFGLPVSPFPCANGFSRLLLAALRRLCPLSCTARSSTQRIVLVSLTFGGAPCSVISSSFTPSFWP